MLQLLEIYIKIKKFREQDWSKNINIQKLLLSKNFSKNVKIL